MTKKKQKKSRAEKIGEQAARTLIELSHMMYNENTKRNFYLGLMDTLNDENTLKFRMGCDTDESERGVTEKDLQSSSCDGKCVHYDGEVLNMCEEMKIILHYGE